MTGRLGRKSKVTLVVVAIVAVQLGAWWIYRRLEHARLTSKTATSLEYELIDTGLGELDAPLQRRDGTSASLRDHRGRPLLVHFWATWCAPCRSELPKLIQLGRETRVRIVLVSTDEGWPVVEHFFEGEVPDLVVLDAGGKARRAFGVSSLPDTYLIDRNGKPTARFRGTREWAAESVRRKLVELAEDSNGRRAR